MAVKSENNNFYIMPIRDEAIKVATVGTMAGLAIPMFGMLIANYAIGPICVGQTGLCDDPTNLSYQLAAIIITIVAAVVIIQLKIYRGLLIVLAAAIAMWSLRKFTIDLSQIRFPEFVAFSTVLHGLSYMLFYWLLRFKNFVVSLVVTGAAIVLICVTLALS